MTSSTPLPQSTDQKVAKRGKLKIFLGYASGVGKTCAMLESALQQRAEGVDVVVGYVDTHHLAETEALLAGFEIVQRKNAEFRAGSQAALDVDAILSRRPALVLVDELAHSNTFESRHPKRYLDVYELLESGLDVYTTLNIQHLESLKDVVARITELRVHDSLPDRIIDEADELQLVDLSPEELLKRYSDGKVFIAEPTSRTAGIFFRKGNLTALREMALRRAAEWVDVQMRAYMRASAIKGPWAAAERILVCVSPGELGERLVRSARHLADELKAEWFAVYVETPSHLALSQAKRDQITRTLQLAEDLGARTKIIPGSASIQSISQLIMEYARKHNITKLVAGKPIRPRWLDLLRGSLVDDLIYRSGEIDVYVITNTQPGRIPPEENPLRLHSSWTKYALGVLLVSLATGLGFLVKVDISPTNLVMIYLLAVMIAAFYLGRGPAILVSLLGVAAFDFFFVPPYYTLVVSQTEYIITFIGLFLVGVVISALAVRAREEAESAQRREADTARLYALSRDLAAAEGMEMVTRAIRTHLESDFGRDVVIYLPRGEILHPYLDPESNQPAPGEAELSLAVWSYRHAEPAGLGTNTLPSAEPRFMPLKTQAIHLSERFSICKCRG